MNPWTRAGAAGIGMLVTLLAPASPIYAQNNVINACVNSVNGSVRIVSSPSECRPPEVPSSWNVAGQPGPPGEQGPKGDQGDPGPQNVVAISVHGGLTASKTANIPNLGPVTVSCVGGASILDVGPAAVQIRADTTLYKSDLTTERIFFDYGHRNGIFETAASAPGKTMVLYVDNDLGVWKIEATLFWNPSTPDACYALAIVTIAD